MNLSKAFDCVHHEILLTKITCYDGSVVTFPTSNNMYPEIKSGSLNLNIGVPQGSVLDHLLFLIYIDDIVNSSNVLSFVLFAVDTTVYVQNDSIDSAIEILKY